MSYWTRAEEKSDDELPTRSTGDDKKRLLPAGDASALDEANASSSIGNPHSFNIVRTMTVSSLVVVFALISACCATLGYQCAREESHFWGQYSPYFSVPSQIPNIVPPGCKITLASALYRHGARYPTASKTIAYNETISQIKRSVKNYGGKYAFLSTYQYRLGADDLTPFGQQGMVNAGLEFHHRYASLSRGATPFVRAASQERVVNSAQNFTQGIHSAKILDPLAFENPFPIAIEVLPEDEGFNNTLSHGLCTNFENGPLSKLGSTAQGTWAAIFVPPIQSRLNADLRGANLSLAQIINVMDLCPFETVASAQGSTLSPFCALFRTKEWRQYDYYQSLGKYYGYGSGNPLGSTQGVGFANELIARMTGQQVLDETSTNHTLDENPATFPIGSQALFADFSHDNDLSGHFAALGLYNVTAALSNTTSQSTSETGGFSASWTVPFAARAYFEKQRCIGQNEDLVRILVNDRVIPLQNCDSDALGRCRLSKWVQSLAFPRSNGLWSQCFLG